MENLTPQQWAEGLRGDLTLGGERVPFDRALKHHLAGLATLRARGLTWRSLANLLRKNDVKRPDSRFYSADHLRVSYNRLIKAVEIPAELPKASRRGEGQGEAMSVVSASPLSGHDDGRAPGPILPSTNIRTPARPSVTADADKDLSADELARIAARLNTLNK